jgi:hypothetical protein
MAHCRHKGTPGQRKRKEVYRNERPTHGGGARPSLAQGRVDLADATAPREPSDDQRGKTHQKSCLASPLLCGSRAQRREARLRAEGEANSVLGSSLCCCVVGSENGEGEGRVGSPRWAALEKKK